MKIKINSPRIEGILTTEMTVTSRTTYKEVLDFIESNIPAFNGVNWSYWNVRALYKVNEVRNKIAIATGAMVSSQAEGIVQLSDILGDEVASLDAIGLVFSADKNEGGEVDLTPEQKELLLAEFTKKVNPKVKPAPTSYTSSVIKVDYEEEDEDDLFDEDDYSAPSGTVTEDDLFDEL